MNSSVFSKHQRGVFVVVYAVGLFSVLAEFLFFDFPSAPYFLNSYYLFTDLFLLGSSHAALSIASHLFLDARRFSLGSAIEALFVGSLLFFACFKILQSNSSAQISYLGAFLFLDCLLRLYHTIDQWRDLTSNYNQKMRTENELDAYLNICLRNNHRREKTAYAFLGIVSVLAFSFYQYHQLHPAPWLLGIAFFGMLLSLNICYFILHQAQKKPHHLRSEKFSFSLRLLLVPFLPLSTAAHIGTRVLHGFESLFLIQKKLAKTSSLFRKTFFFLTSFFALAIWVKIFLILHNTSLPHAFTKTDHIWLSMAFSITFLHYYIEKRTRPGAAPGVSKPIEPQKSLFTLRKKPLAPDNTSESKVGHTNSKPKAS